MHRFLKNRKFLLLSILFLLTIFIIVSRYRDSYVTAAPYNPGAGTGDNVSGFAWSSNIGWISFNCADSNTCSGGINEGSFCNVAADCPGGSCVDTCDNFSDYGVHMDQDTGDFSGYAWNSNVGWIYFGPDPSMLADVPQNPGHWARYDDTTGHIDGWAKILSMGDGGWIKMDDSGTGGFAWDGVEIDFSGTGDFSGWAWNASSTVVGAGWISFNCSNSDTCLGGVNHGNFCNANPDCPGGSCVDTCTNFANYKVNVFNSYPSITNMTAPNWGGDAPCGIVGARYAQLRWDYNHNKGLDGTEYRLVVRRTDDTRVFDTGRCTTDTFVCTENCDLNLTNSYCMLGPFMDGTSGYQYSLGSSVLDYGTSYKWELYIWDTVGSVGFAQFDTTIPGHVLTDNAAENVATSSDPTHTFTTYRHEFPDTFFNWFPHDPSIGERVDFIDSSIYYDFNTPANDIITSCSGLYSCSWQWTSLGGGIFIESDTTSSTALVFNSSGFDNGVELRVTDNDGYSCSTSTDFGIILKSGLPIWKESK